MSATNGVGYEVQVWIDKRIGWVTELAGFSSLEAAQSVLDVLPVDGKERRAYESLEGY